MRIDRWKARDPANGPVNANRPIKAHLRGDAGVTAVEYGVIIALVIVGSISLILLAGQGLNTFFSTGSENLAGAATCQAGSPGCSVVPTPTPTPTPTPLSLTGTIGKSSKNAPSVLTVNALQGVAGTPSLDISSVAISAAPAGAAGASVTSTAAGAVSFTAPTNKTGTFTIAFTYTVNGVTVQGSTISITVT